MINMDYIIKETNILIVQIAIYDDINNGILLPRELDEESILRPAVFVNNHIIDFKTGQEIFPVEVNHQGVIQSSIYANTMYAMETYKHPNVTQDYLLYAVQVYEKFKEQEEILKSDKIIKFPQKCLFYNRYK